VREAIVGARLPFGLIGEAHFEPGQDDPAALRLRERDG
jgi:hypothetical protein